RPSTGRGRPPWRPALPRASRGPLPTDLGAAVPGWERGPPRRAAPTHRWLVVVTRHTVGKRSHRPVGAALRGGPGASRAAGRGAGGPGHTRPKGDGPSGSGGRGNRRAGRHVIARAATEGGPYGGQTAPRGPTFPPGTHHQQTSVGRGRPPWRPALPRAS